MQEEEGQKKIKTVLITRSVTDNIDLQCDLEKIGFKVIKFPIIKHKTILSKESNLFHSVQNSIITSKYAAKIIASLVKTKLSCFVVGAESAKILQKNPFINLVSVYKDVKELLQDVNNKYNKNSYTYFCGNYSSFNPPTAWKLVQIYEVDYASKVPAEIISYFLNRQINYILIYSYNTAKKLIELLTKSNLLCELQYTTIVSISYKVSRIFDNIPCKVLFPEVPNHKDIIKVLLNYEKSQ